VVLLNSEALPGITIFAVEVGARPSSSRVGSSWCCAWPRGCR